jgi:hypothetical protein
MDWGTVHPIHARQLVNQLDGVFSFARHLGLGSLAEAGRFAEHRKTIAALVASMEPDEKGMIAGVADGLFPSHIDDSIALTETMELCFAVPYLMTQDPLIVTEKLKLVLSGPILLKEERAHSNQARNTLFEIHLAAQAARASVITHLGPVSDILCEFRGRQLFIECKRPHSATKVARRIREAEAQILHHLRLALPQSRGVVAISLSRVLNPESVIFAMTDPAEGQRVFEEKVQAIAEECRNSWSRLSRKVIGIVFTATAPGLEPGSAHFLTLHHSLGYTLAGGRAAEQEMFSAWHERIASVVPFL